MTNACSPTTYTLGTVQQGPPCCVPEAHMQIRDLRIAYNHTTVIDQVNLDIYRGCITALIGPSGCGKTSLLNALNRLTDLIPGASVRGCIQLNGQSIDNNVVSAQGLRTKIGMIFQKPNPFPFSIRKNIELALRERGIKQKALLAQRTEKALREVGLWDEVHNRLDSPALLLSGGQQQRLCIARALALEPEVLLMDEPCSALDPIASGVVEELIVSLRGRYTVVIVTHNLAQARRIANYAAFFWMRDKVGKLIEFGQSQTLFDQPSDALTAAYVSGSRG